MAKFLRADLTRSGCPDKFENHNITFHATRRSFSTMASEHPEAAAVKFALMGHAAPDVDAGHYNAVNEGRKRRVVASIPLKVTVGDINGESSPSLVQFLVARPADDPWNLSLPNDMQPRENAL